MNTVFTHCNRLMLTLCLCLVGIGGCKDDDSAQPQSIDLVKNEEAAVALEWMKLFVEIDRYVQDFRPGPVSRSLAYINLAAYESVMKGMPEFKSVQGLFTGLVMPIATENNYHYPTVVNAVYANLFKRFVPAGFIFPEQQSDLQFDILALEESFNSMFKTMVGTDVFNRSKEYGEAVANTVWEWSKTDSFGHDAHENANPTGYTPPSGPGLWQPTAPEFSIALFPYWGKARTFSIGETEKLADDPMSFSEEGTSQFYVQALEVRNRVMGLEFADQWEAEFWSDDFTGQTFSPVSRWISITNQIIEKDECHLEIALYAYAKVSLALNDASVAAWHSKYTYNVERPVSYINRVLDSDWAPHLNSTPNFPSYPSGHAAFGAASAEVLSHIFGYDYDMSDESHDGRSGFLGMPRSFDTFYQMAEENATSRISAGVNFRMDTEEGLNLGFKIGRKVNEMPFK